MEGVTPAWNWHLVTVFVLVDTLGFVLVKVLFFIGVDSVKKHC